MPAAAASDAPVDGGRLAVTPSADELRRQVSAIHWYHSIDLGNGVVTPGTPVNRAMLERGVPELRGRRVLDIGAWDGLYSFAAERCGAESVTAMDHYAWCVDFDARNRYWAECEAEGRLPDHRRDLTDFYRPDDLPGRRGFDLAKRVLGSEVVPVVADFMDVDPEALGRFDVVLLLGVLYHVRDPLGALERVRALTSEVAVIETEAIEVLGMPDATVLDFTAGAELRGDYTNWFVPARAALEGMCLAAGFSAVETVIGPPARSVRLRSAARRAFDAAREVASKAARGGAPARRASDLPPAAHAPAPLPLHRYRITVHARA